MHDSKDLDSLRGRLREAGFAFLDAEDMRARLDGPQALADWAAFAASWNDLPPDAYLAARGRHRRRRHAAFSVDAGGAIRREPPRPHYQSVQYNPLQGDIERWFEPIEPAVGDGPSLRRILRFGHALFAPLAGAARDWQVEVHQFRIEARAGEAGEPTPEGIHRDGVDYVLVLLVDRENIESGTTTIHDAGGALLGSFTLTRALDAALVDDARVWHGVTPVTPSDPQQAAHRDVLVVTYKAAT